MRSGITVRRWQDATLVLRQESNSTAATSDTGAGSSAAGAVTSGAATAPSSGATTDSGSSSSPTDGVSQSSFQGVSTSPTDSIGTVQSTPSYTPSTSPSSNPPTTTTSNTNTNTNTNASTYTLSSSASTSSSQATATSQQSSTAPSSSSPGSSSISPSSSPSTSPTSSSSLISSSPSPSTTAPPTSSLSSSGRVTTIGTSTLVESINGQLTTSLEPIVTTLSDTGSSGLSPAANKGIIAGSVVGVCALLALAFAMVVFYRRHRHKKLDFFKRKQPKPRNMLLAGEDLDDYDMGPPMANYQDYPGSIVSHSASPSVVGHNSPSHNRDVTTGSLNGSPMDPHGSYSRVNVSGGMPSPHLMGMRTSETGSLFQEQVWPPPRSPFVDPLVSTEDLTRIVDNVMGLRDGSGGKRHPSSPLRADSRLRGGHESTTSLDSAPDLSISERHTRSASQTTLLPPASPPTPTWRTPLFITNMGNETSSIYSQQSPPPGVSKHLSGGADVHHALSTEGESMGEAL